MKLSELEIERLRQSGIKLDAEGRFWHEGEEVRHAGLRAALWRWLDRNPDGRYVLRLDERRFAWVEVEDAPHAVRSVRWDGDRAIALLADGEEEEIDYGTLRMRDWKVYCKVKGGKWDARLSSAAWATLGERLVEREGQYLVEAAGRAWPVAGAEAMPDGC